MLFGRRHLPLLLCALGLAIVALHAGIIARNRLQPLGFFPRFVSFFLFVISALKHPQMQRLSPLALAYPNTVVDTPPGGCVIRVLPAILSASPIVDVSDFG